MLFTIEVSKSELGLFLQWFESLQDVNPNFLKLEDYKVAKEIYKTLGLRIPHSVYKGISEKMIEEGEK